MHKYALALTLALSFGLTTTACDKKGDDKADKKTDADKKDDKKAEADKTDDKKEDEKKADDKKEEGGW